MVLSITAKSRAAAAANLSFTVCAFKVLPSFCLDWEEKEKFPLSVFH